MGILLTILPLHLFPPMHLQLYSRPDMSSSVANLKRKRVVGDSYDDSDDEIFKLLTQPASWKVYSTNKLSENSTQDCDEQKQDSESKKYMPESDLYEESSESEGQESPEDSATGGHDYSFAKRRGTSVHGFVDPPKRTPTKYTPDAFASYSDDKWQVSQCSGDNSPYSTMKETQTDRSYTVRFNRIPKAKLHLSYDSTLEAMRPSSCKCKRSCYKLIMSPDRVLEFREKLFTAADNEGEALELLVDSISANRGKLTIPVTTSGKSTTDIKVCRKYYAAIHGVSEGKVSKAKKLAACGPRRTLSNESTTRDGGQPVGGRPTKKYNLAYAFWDAFFEKNCQKPNDEIRLFPVEKTYRMIYDEYFVPWFARQVDSDGVIPGDKPKLTVFKEARFHNNFNDVKGRAKHTHARCNECSELRALCLEAFKSGLVMAQYKQRRRLHDEAVKQWRQLEASCKARATSTPHEVLVLMHDGTQAMGLPRLGHRSIKNLDPFRFEVTPWLNIDFSSGNKDYVYSPTFHTVKDANYLISQLHSMIRRAKSDYDHPRHLARKLICIADSASENKNNTLFAYLTDLVGNGWFDEVELLFGPVGHTHNGVDALHKIHNQNVAANFSADLGHFVHNYPAGFATKEHGIPEASILTKIVDWKSYYAHCVRHISGFIKSQNDPILVRGFRIAKTSTGSVELTWKADPALEKDWRGASGYPNTPGFYMLKTTPEGLPTFVPQKPSTSSRDVKDAQSGDEPSLHLSKQAATEVRKRGYHHQKCEATLRGPQFAQILASRGTPAAAEWNFIAATTGKIPVHEYLEASVTPGKWGRLALIGSTAGKRARMRLIESHWNEDAENTHKSLWALPFDSRPDGRGHILASTNVHHFSLDASILQRAPIPAVRYRGENARTSEVARHPQCGVSNNRNGERLVGGWVSYESSSSPAPPTPDPGPDPVSISASSAQSSSSPHSVPPHSPSNPPDPGSSSQNGKPSVNYHFEVPWSQCKVGTLVIMLLHGAPPTKPFHELQSERDYIEVGLITALDASNRTFQYHKFHCTKDPWLETCYTLGKFHKSKKNEDHSIQGKHYSVISYFDRLLKTKSLPRAQKKAIEERGIAWTAPPNYDQSSSESDSD